MSRSTRSRSTRIVLRGGSATGVSVFGMSGLTGAEFSACGFLSGTFAGLDHRGEGGRVCGHGLDRSLRQPARRSPDRSPIRRIRKFRGSHFPREVVVSLDRPGEIGALGIEFGEQRQIGLIAIDVCCAEPGELAQDECRLVGLGIEGGLRPKADRENAFGGSLTRELAKQCFDRNLYRLKDELLRARFPPVRVPAPAPTPNPSASLPSSSMRACGARFIDCARRRGRPARDRRARRPPAA